MKFKAIGLPLVAALLFFQASAGNAPAQPESPSNGTAPSSTPSETIAGPPAVTPVDQFPPAPGGFFRGNRPGDSGFYINMWRFVPVVGSMLLWVWVTGWVRADARALKLDAETWNTWVVLGGLAGLMLVVSLPRFAWGIILMVAGGSVPFSLYVRERNSRVPAAARILTKDHIRNVTVRQLARLGIKVGSKEFHQATVGPDIHFIGKSAGKGEGDRSRQVESSKGYLAAKELVYDAITRRSTDIHLEPRDDELAIRLRVDGVMYPAEPYDISVGEAVVNIFKVLGAMDITEKRRPQDGSFQAELEGREIDFRVATQGTRHGEKMSLRILDQANAVSTLAGMGLRKALQDKIERVVHQPHGLFLSCGPTGAGKSTTLYAALNAIDAFQRNIITIEDPVEYKIPNVTQIEINTKSGQTFAQSLRSILRQDPDVVMVGEIRDGETANIPCQAATTGHMGCSTLHANDTITALYRLMDLGVEPFMVASSISALLGQRLARRLCPECRHPYRPNPELLRKANLPVDKIDKFFRPPKLEERPETCLTCDGLGYKGRIAVVEFLEITDRMRDFIRDKSPVADIKAEARKNDMLYMREEGLRLVVRGITSIEEVLRVVK